MNRREFTASLAALGFMPALPTAVTPIASASPTVPAGAYAWAHLIARAQSKCSPEMLARQLHLSPDVARQLFNTMLSDGVLKTPSASGVAKAVQPIDATGTDRSIAPRLRTGIKNVLNDDQTDKDVQGKTANAPLATDAEPCLGCDNAQTEDLTDACTDQSLQESTARR